MRLLLHLTGHFQQKHEDLVLLGQLRGLGSGHFGEDTLLLFALQLLQTLQDDPLSLADGDSVNLKCEVVVPDNWAGGALLLRLLFLALFMRVVEGRLETLHDVLHHTDAVTSGTEDYQTLRVTLSFLSPKYVAKVLAWPAFSADKPERFLTVQTTGAVTDLSEALV